MAKKKINFMSVTDGLPPSRSVGPSKAFNLKAPLPLNLPPNAKREVKLGVFSADYPLATFAPTSAVNAGLTIQTPGIVDAGVEVVVTVANLTDELKLVDVGDVLCRAIPLEAVDFEFGP